MNPGRTPLFRNSCAPCAKPPRPTAPGVIFSVSPALQERLRRSVACPRCREEGRQVREENRGPGRRRRRWHRGTDGSLSADAGRSRGASLRNARALRRAHVDEARLQQGRHVRGTRRRAGGLEPRGSHRTRQGTRRGHAEPQRRRAGVDFYHFGGKLYTDKDVIAAFEPLAKKHRCGRGRALRRQGRVHREGEATR